MTIGRRELSGRAMLGVGVGLAAGRAQAQQPSRPSGDVQFSLCVVADPHCADPHCADPHCADPHCAEAPK